MPHSLAVGMNGLRLESGSMPLQGALLSSEAGGSMPPASLAVVVNASSACGEVLYCFVAIRPVRADEIAPLASTTPVNSEPILTLKHENRVDGLALSADGKTAAGATFKFNAGKGVPVVWLWNLQTGQPIKSWEITEGLTALALSPDGKTLATGGKGTITLWG